MVEPGGLTARLIFETGNYSGPTYNTHLPPIRNEPFYQSAADEKRYGSAQCQRGFILLAGCSSGIDCSLIALLLILPLTLPLALPHAIPHAFRNLLLDDLAALEEENELSTIRKPELLYDVNDPKVAEVAAAKGILPSFDSGFESGNLRQAFRVRKPSVPCHISRRHNFFLSPLHMLLDPPSQL